MPNKFKIEKKADKDDFALYIAEVLRDAHYIPMVPPVDIIRQTWRKEAPYTRELRDLIIQKTKTFIVSRSNTHLIFLSDLTKWMAKYLSYWTQWDAKYDDIRNKSISDAQAAARTDLEKELFDDFEYIKRLQKKAKNKQKRNAAKNAEHRKRHEAAEQVGDGFICRVTKKGETLVCRTAGDAEPVMDSAPAEIERVLEDFDKARAGHKRPRIRRSK